MRTVLIAATGLALLAAPTGARAQDELEFRGSDRITTCEVFGDVSLAGNPVDRVQFIRGGLDPDIVIEGVEPFFGGPDGITLCEALAEKEPRRLCRENNRGGKTADTYTFVYAFKKLAVDLNALPPHCNAPTDPGCVDLFGATQLRMEIFDGGLAAGLCAELLRP